MVELIENALILLQIKLQNDDKSALVRVVSRHLSSAKPQPMMTKFCIVAWHQ